MHIEQVDITSLKPAEYNPRKLSETQEKALKQSLQKFGCVDPIVVNNHPDRMNIIVGGHQRVKVWQSIGHTSVPVFYVTLDKEQERELNVRLNHNTGSFDWVLLQEFFKKDELMSWGFTEDDLYGRFKNKTTGDDDAPGLPATPKSKTGDQYELGPHRLMCGNSTSEDVKRLMAGELADMIFTDPPYNVNYKGAGKDTTRTIENDNMEENAFRTFLVSAFKRMHEATKKTAALYCCYASRTHREFEDGVNAAGYEFRNQIIWVKTVASMGWGDYRWKHEPMLYCIKIDGGKPDFFADRTQTTAWDEMPNDAELLETIKKMIKKEEDGNSTVWRFSREANYVHPTQKPVALVTKALINSCSTHGIVLDLFGGSGSTLIAAEKNERKAFLMEMDPGFVDVIVKRYADFCIKNGRKWCVLRNNVDVSSEYGQKETGDNQVENGN